MVPQTAQGSVLFPWNRCGPSFLLASNRVMRESCWNAAAHHIQTTTTGTVPPVALQLFSGDHVGTEPYNGYMATATEPAFVPPLRLRKATILADQCRMLGMTADDAAHIEYADRREVERLAGTNPGSALTWRLVVGLLAGSASARCPSCGMGDPLGSVGPPLDYGHAGPCQQ